MKDNSILDCCKKPRESGDRVTLKSTFYIIELHTIILYIIFLPKHCRLFLSTKDLFVLIVEKNFKLGRDKRTCFLNDRT